MDSSRPTSDRKLEGKVAIITGGANGIGEATARLFVENGAWVVIADIQDQRGAQLVEELGGGHVATFKHCDVLLESDIEDLVAFTLKRWGRLDVMFNNAGNMGRLLKADVRELDVADFDYIMALNGRGMALGVKHAGKAMVDAKIKGSIICTASIASVFGGMGAPTAYTMSKHATVGLVRAAACDLGKYGIRVNCVSPMSLPTNLEMGFMRKHYNPSMSVDEAQVIFDSKNNLAHHSLSVLDVAKAVLHLASDDAAFVSGVNHMLDGGYSCGKNLFET